MRSRNTIAKVAVNNAAYSFDLEYSYRVPEEISSLAEPGLRVMVPFGRANKNTIGFITRIYDELDFDPKIKPMIKIIDNENLISKEMLDIIFWLKENTFCTFFEAFKTVVPTGFSYNLQEHFKLVNTYIDSDTLSEEEKNIIDFLKTSKNQREIDKVLDYTGNTKKKNLINGLIDKGYIEKINSLKRKVNDENVNMVCISEDFLTTKLDVKFTPKQKLIVDFLKENGCASIKEVCYMTNCTSTIINNLINKKVLHKYKYEIMRTPISEISKRKNPDEIILNSEQQKSFDGILSLIKSNTPSGALLYGVTGSGKTSVFIKLIDACLKMGKTALLLVPEISLTPQMLAKFTELFGSNIAVLHSSLSLGQRTDEFKRIKKNDAKIVIGTRSAVFAPLSNIGLIIMDEEGEQSYKSDSSPRYHARDVAIKRCGYHNCVLLMASATPSLESFYYAKKKRYHLFELKTRYANAILPKVNIIDMQEENANGNSNLFSQQLIDKITETLDKKEQVILLLNRRGFTTYISCASCRQPIVCPKCNIPLTYHSKNNLYMCHYCGYTMDNKKVCPYCGSDKIKSSGAGTQKVENEIERFFPNAKILRMDADTTSSRYSYEEKFKAFENGEYDIMLGTQMIAKGLNFPNVTLVGVISLDKALFTGDFRSYERTFSLLTQVAGRSGRGDKPGEAYIQTFVPDHYVINLAAEQNYDEFYNEEIALRKALIYPPFCDLCVIGFSSEIESKAILASRWFTENLINYIRSNSVKFPLRALGPAPCTLEMINGRYRYRLILKTRNCSDFRIMISRILDLFYKNKDFKNVRIFADINGDIGL